MGIDTGIQSGIDDEQGDWLRTISKLPKDKILLTGKPLVVDARSQAVPDRRLQRHRERDRRGSGQPLHRRHRRRHPQLPALSGALRGRARGAAHRQRGGGAYTKATHKIPKATRESCGCDEDDFRCYPRRGDSLAAYSILLDRKLPLDVAIPYDIAPAVMSLRLEGVVDPTRVEDRDKHVPPDVWRKAKIVFPFSDSGIMGPFNKNFSEFLDWNDPDPPLFKSFLRVDTRPGEVEIRCFGATGCEEHADDPPLEDRIKGTRAPTEPGPGRCSLTENAAMAGHLRAAPLPQPRGQEPHLPLERRRPVRQLRRLGHARRGSTGTSSSRAAASARSSPRTRRRRARAHHPGLRVPRLRRDDPVLARARPARARARLQVRRPARLRRPRADGPERRSTTRARARPTSPSRSTASPRADDVGADPGGRPLVRPGRPPRARGRARRHRARRRNGLLFTQFLSSAINDREDEYGGSLENRARFALEVVRAIRTEVGDDFFLGFKISPSRADGELFPWLARGQHARGVDPGLQVARGGRRRHAPRLHRRRVPASAQPGRPLPGARHGPDLRRADLEREAHVPELPGLQHVAALRGFRWWWERPARNFGVEGINLAARARVKQAVDVPVLCTGGFQTASVIAEAIEDGAVDGVTIARPLVANPDLVRHFEAGPRPAPRPCTYCNKCLFNFVENPLGCYEEAGSTRGSRCSSRSSPSTASRRFSPTTAVEVA